MPLQIADIVPITATIRSSGAASQSFGRALFLTHGDDATVGALAGSGSGRVKPYATLADVGRDFPASSDAFIAASRFFGQPSPRNFLVGRWRQAAVDWRIRGGQVTSLPGTLTSTGSLNFAGTNYTGIDISAATSLAGIATVINTSLGAAGTFTFDTFSQRFQVASSSAISAGFAPHSAGTGDDLSALLRLRAEDGALDLPGGAAETLAAGLTGIQQEDDSFYFVLGQSSASVIPTQMAAWSNGAGTLYIGEDSAAGTLTANESSSQAAQVFAGGSNRAAMIFSRAAADYKAASVAGAMSSIDFAGAGTLRTAKFLSLPGCSQDSFTTAEAVELERKRTNYYAGPSGTPIFGNGECAAAGVWIDAQVWLDWIRAEMQTEVFNLLRGSVRIPMNAAGMAVVRDTIAGICRRGVTNGGISPGSVPAAVAQEIRTITGNSRFDGNLSNGFMIWHPPVSQLSASDRTARRAPSVRVWLRASGAVHRVALNLSLEE